MKEELYTSEDRTPSEESDSFCLRVLVESFGRRSPINHVVPAQLYSFTCMCECIDNIMCIDAVYMPSL